MKILVTGSSGYLGNILIPYLLNNQIDVFGIDLFHSNILSNEKQFVCDITNLSLLEKKIGLNTFDVIIHLASEIDFAKKNQNELYVNNINMTKI
jgi:nucleoside-diphosphate-sugar epimerase